jgi:hypothetical protein
MFPFRNVYFCFQFRPVNFTVFYCILLKNISFLNATSIIHPVCFPVTIPINPLKTKTHSDFRKFASITGCSYGKGERRKLTALY